MSGATFTAGPSVYTSAVSTAVPWSGATVGAPLILFANRAAGISTPSGWTKLDTYVFTRTAPSAAGSVDIKFSAVEARIVAVSAGPVPTSAYTNFAGNGSSPVDVTGVDFGDVNDALVFGYASGGTDSSATLTAQPATLADQVLDASSGTASTGGVAAAAWKITDQATGTCTVAGDPQDFRVVSVVPVSGMQQETSTGVTATMDLSLDGFVSPGGQGQTVTDAMAVLGLSLAGSDAVAREGEVETATGAFPALGFGLVGNHITLDQAAAGATGFGLGLSGATTQQQTVASRIPALLFRLSGASTQQQTVTGATSTLGLSLAGVAKRFSDNASGLGTRLVVYTANGDLLGDLPAPLSWSASIVRQDKGALQLEYSTAGPEAQMLSAPVEVAIQYFDGETFVEADNARYLILGSSVDDVDPTGTVAYQGTSQDFRLSKAAVYDGPTDGITPGERRFTSSTVGRILRMLADEAIARGALDGADLSTFTATHDSAGASWSQVISIGYQVGVTLDTVVQNLADQGMCDVTWQGRIMRVVNADTGTRDLTTGAAPVVLQQGRDIKQASDQKTWDQIASAGLVRGDSGISIEVDNADAQQPWGRWETVYDDGGVTDEDSLTAYGTQQLALCGDPQAQYTHDLNFLYAQSLPLVDYEVGDYVFSDTNGTPERLRVAQVTLSGDQTGITAGNVVLNDRLTEALVALNKRVQGITGGAGGTGPLPAPVDPSDRTTPTAPVGLAVVTSVYKDDNGQQISQVDATWTDPATNTDGTDCDDLFAIQIWAKPTRTGTTWRLLTTQDPGVGRVTYSPLPVGDTYQFRATAIDHASHVSDSSNVVQVDLSKDVTPPPTPAAPDISSDNAVLTVSWGGEFADGTSDRPVDLDRILVYASTGSSVPVTAGNLRGTMAGDVSSVTIPGVGVNQTWYARLVAVDQTGNRSAASTVSSTSVEPIDGGDIGGGTVGGDQIDVPGLDSLGNVEVENLYGKTITGITLLASNLNATGDNGSRITVDGDRVTMVSYDASVHSITPTDASMTVNASGELRLYGSGSRLILGGSGSGSYAKCPPIYSNITTASTNLHVAGDYTLQRVTSLRAYKTNITDINETIPAATVLNLRPVTYRDKGRVERGEHAPTMVGLIAEEVAAAYPELATFDDEGVLNGVAYDRVAVALLPIIKDLAARVAELESKES